MAKHAGRSRVRTIFIAGKAGGVEMTVLFNGSHEGVDRIGRWPFTWRESMT
jgi:hypothetical protein